MTRLGSGAAVLIVAAGWLALAPSQGLGQKRQRDVISREEIEQSPQRSEDILRVIRSLRPHFLEGPRGVRQTRIDPAPYPGALPVVGAGGSSAAETVVYIERNQLGGVDALRTILADQVGEVRYLDPSRAQTEFGQSAGGGAIVIKLYKGVKPDTKPPGAE